MNEKEYFGINFKDLADKFNSIFNEIHAKKEPPPFKEQLKLDAVNAAYRVGSKQLISLTKELFVQHIRGSCSEESKVRAVAELLDTEVGIAIMAMFIGSVAASVPQLSNNPKMNRVLKEFRVSGISSIGNLAIEAVVSEIIPIIGTAVQKPEISSFENTDALPEEDLRPAVKDNMRLLV